MSKIKRLVIAEKPALGRAIAKELGVIKTHYLESENEEGKTVRGNASYIECNNGDFVTWCFGHMLEQAEPHIYDPKYKKWVMADLPIIPDKWQLLPKSESGEQLNNIVDLIGKAEMLINAGDPDREGDLLIEEVFDYANITEEQRKTALRLEISDFNPTKVQEALANMRPNVEFLPRMQAALARSRADWILGMNYSRICTILGKLKGHNEKLVVGRVQTPVLTLVVMRDMDIIAFQAQTFFTVFGQFEKDGIEFQAKWITEDRCLEKEAANNVAACLEKNKAVIIKCETKRAKAQPPLPFSLLSLQKLMSKKYNVSASKTLEVLQKLYEAKLVSYPRTDMNYLFSAKKEEAPLIFAAIRKAPLFPQMLDWIDGADLSLTSSAWNDDKLKGEAHTAIIPMVTCGQDAAILEKNNDAKNMFYEIVARYVAQFYPAAEDDKTVIELEQTTHLFRTTGNIERVAGWRSILGQEKDDKDKDSIAQTLPSLEIGSQLACLGSNIKEGTTTPPKPHTDETLLDAMENIARMVDDEKYKKILKDAKGLGTSATRAGMLKGLEDNHYIETTTVGKTTYIVSTPTGKMLILALPANLRDPVTTAVWELQLSKIENEGYPYNKFMDKVTERLDKDLNAFRTGAYPFKLPESTATKCECGGYILRANNTEKPFWVCTTCDKRYKDNDGLLGKPFSDKKKMDGNMKDTLKKAVQA